MRFFTLLAVLLSLSFPVSAQNTPPPGAVYPSAPFTGSSFFATARCISGKFTCSPSPSNSTLISRANMCAQETFAVGDIMGKVGSARDGYQNCVLPTTYKDDPNGTFKKKWTICCVVPKSNGMCTFDCHLYYNNNQ